ncbi:GlxA family transcriptional regulator [Pseudomonas sp. Pseu.R1]|uniref:GlxA family transcriptional regulator n=1 Tax=Pseudomonas sp. Pseu.R1 TaxID=3379818 RepID=UPI003B933750
MSRLFTFLLIPGFSMMDFAAVAEPLRSANRMGGDLYRWRTISQDGQPVAASNGMSIAVDGALLGLGPEDTLIIVAAYEPMASISAPLTPWLRRQDKAGVTLGGIDTGAFVLAHAGLMKGYRMTVHWEAIDAFLESYPGLQVSHELYEIDQRRLTSAGGTASMDLMLELIAQAHGSELALKVAEQFVHGPIRARQVLQRLEAPKRYNFTNRKIHAVIERIEQNLEKDMDVDDLARGVCVTRRHLERLFRATVQASPAEFRQRLRLDKARQLLQQSDLTILQISVACGYESPSYFARCYKERFKCTPRQDRAILTGRCSPAQAQ